MQTFLITFLLFACFIFSSCSFGTQDIEEISRIIGGRDSKGDGHFYEIKFRKDGVAEELNKKFVHDVTVTEQSHSRGKISKEQFDKLADTINGTAFFSAEDKGATLDSSEIIKVTYSKGVKVLQTNHLTDADKKAILDMIDQISKQIEWEKID